MHRLSSYEAMDDTVDSYFAGEHASGRAIYLTVLALALAGLALLPVVRVSVSVQSPGVLRPTVERQAVRASTSGILRPVRLSLNQAVRRGDTLAVVSDQASEERLRHLDDEVRVTAQAESEITHLIETVRSGRPATFETQRYRQELASYQSEQASLMMAERRARDELARTTALFAKTFASAQDLAARQFDAQRASADRLASTDRWMRDWESARTAARASAAQVLSSREELLRTIAANTIVAAADGSISEVRGLAPGTFVQAGEDLAVLSPDTGLVAEVYVSPRDIGMIRRGGKVRLLVDAFNYNDWGAVEASVSDVASDVSGTATLPMFRVHCVLSRTHLTLGNGVRGELRKGMTVRARFMVAERSLLQLMYEDVDAWINPVRSPVPAEVDAARGAAAPGVAS